MDRLTLKLRTPKSTALLGRILGVSLLCLVSATGAYAQLQTAPMQDLSSLNASVSMPTCSPVGLSDSTSNMLVVNLPPIDASTLSNNSYGDIIPILIDLEANASSECINPLSQNIPLEIDQSLVALAPDSGLLRNTAKQNPAGNVLIEIGLFDAQGEFKPFDLRLPMRLQSDTQLVLGVRYVAARAVQLTVSTTSDVVSSGQVAVQLPLLMKVH